MATWGVMPGQYRFLQVEVGLDVPELADAPDDAYAGH